MNNEYNRYYIKIRTVLGIKPEAIHEEHATALASKTPSYPTVAQWAKCFGEGIEDVNDRPRSARPVSKLTNENINDPHSIYDDIVAETFLSHGAIKQIIHDCFKIRKITSPWVPHQLIDE